MFVFNFISSDSRLRLYPYNQISVAANQKYMYASITSRVLLNPVYYIQRWGTIIGCRGDLKPSLTSPFSRQDLTRRVRWPLASPTGRGRTRSCARPCPARMGCSQRRRPSPVWRSMRSPYPARRRSPSRRSPHTAAARIPSVTAAPVNTHLLFTAHNSIRIVYCHCPLSIVTVRCLLHLCWMHNRASTLDLKFVNISMFISY